MINNVTNNNINRVINIRIDHPVIYSYYVYIIKFDIYILLHLIAIYYIYEIRFISGKI
jgi:hypothetical protein